MVFDKKAWMKEYDRKRRQRPEVKAREKETARIYNLRFRQTPVYKARIREYDRKRRQRPEVKAREKETARIYNKGPEVIARKKALAQTPKYQAYIKAYNSKPENKLKQKKNKNKWQRENRDKTRRYMRKWKKKPEAKSSINKQIRQRIKRDPTFRSIRNLRSNFYMAMRLYSTTGKIMKSKDYGINYKKIIEHLKPFPEDITNYEVDHIIPLSLFDHNDPEQIKLAWAPSNLQWLTIEINRWKSDRLIKPLTDKQKERLQKQLTK